MSEYPSAREIDDESMGYASHPSTGNTVSAEFHTCKTSGSYQEQLIVLPDHNDDFGYNPPKMTGEEMLEQLEKIKMHVIRLKTENKKLTKEAEAESPARTAVVIYNHLLGMMLSFMETNKQLKQVINNTGDQEYLGFASELCKKRQRDFGSQSTRLAYSNNTSPSTSEQSSIVPSSERSFSAEPSIDQETGKEIVSTLHMLTKTCKIEEKLKIGSRDAIKTAFQIAKNYPKNEKIEEDFCGFLNSVAILVTSKEGCRNVLSVDILEYLSKVFYKHWKNRSIKQKLISNIIGIYFHCSYSNDYVQHIRKDEYIELLLETFKTTDGFENYDILSGVSLLRIMQYNGGQNWCFTISKEEVDKCMLQGMKKWVIGTKQPVSFDLKSFSNKLADLKDANIVVQRLNAWLIANATNIQAKQYCALLVEADGVQTLNKIVTDPKCDAKVKEFAEIALAKVSKHGKESQEPKKDLDKKEKKGGFGLFKREREIN